MERRNLSAWKIVRLICSASIVALPTVAPPAAASPVVMPLSVSTEIQRLAAGNRELAAFYASRQNRPLWISGGQVGIQGDLLLQLLETAHADGRDPRRYLQLGVREALDAARSGSPQALAVADVVFSSAFAAYVRDVRQPADIGVVYGEATLRPRAQNVLTVLHKAASAPALEDYLKNLGWMHPTYAGLRRALANAPWDGGVISSRDEQLLRVNLERARILPADADRYILVDAAAARLTYYEGGKPRKSMRVIVGTPDQATPMMVGMLRYATLNPYWHVPVDLARERIAPRVLSEGLGYFHGRGYEVVSEWSRDAQVIDPATVDWKAVADGRKDVFIRQKPGPRNGMGNIKFQFPNELGIYLHDTPAKQLFNEDQRGFSAGCVRLEDADALKDLLLGAVRRSHSEVPEQTIRLAQPVPLYITYLTAAAENGVIVHREDVYGRDRKDLAAVRSSKLSSGSMH